jgi:hypothetical protein
MQSLVSLSQSTTGGNQQTANVGSYLSQTAAASFTAKYARYFPLTTTLNGMNAVTTFASGTWADQLTFFGVTSGQTVPFAVPLGTVTLTITNADSISTSGTATVTAVYYS